MYYPRHIALIPDGNRTRARDHDFPQMVGHLRGFENAVTLTKHIFTNTPINICTIWGLSTENLTNRTPDELSYLFNLYKKMTNELTSFVEEQHINCRRVGSQHRLPTDLVAYLQDRTTTHTYPTDKHVVLAVNYGGRDEIVRGVKKWATKTKSLATTLSKIDDKTLEKELSEAMDFGDLSPVDLIIRTKGDEAQRLSGFMSRRAGYAELYFTPKKFPELSSNDLTIALERFDSIATKRNFGK